MCSHYEAPTQSQLALEFGIDLCKQGKLDLWLGYFGPFIPDLNDRQKKAA